MSCATCACAPPPTNKRERGQGVCVCVCVCVAALNCAALRALSPNLFVGRGMHGPKGGCRRRGGGRDVGGCGVLGEFAGGVCFFLPVMVWVRHAALHSAGLPPPPCPPTCPLSQVFCGWLCAGGCGAREPRSTHSAHHHANSQAITWRTCRSCSFVGSSVGLRRIFRSVSKFWRGVTHPASNNW